VQLLISAAEGPKGLQRGFIIYLYSRGKLEEKILNSLPEPIKKTIMNTLDIYIEKGRKEGIEEGIEKGIEKGKEEEVRNLILKLGLTDKQAAEVAEVSTSFVKKIRTSLKKKKQE
jgi:flagellar biosynthesis/type III secretory pathway protein FliH